MPGKSHPLGCAFAVSVLRGILRCATLWAQPRGSIGSPCARGDSVTWRRMSGSYNFFTSGVAFIFAPACRSYFGSKPHSNPLRHLHRLARAEDLPTHPPCTVAGAAQHWNVKPWWVSPEPGSDSSPFSPSISSSGDDDTVNHGLCTDFQQQEKADH